jgi:hypothetical protein
MKRPRIETGQILKGVSAIMALVISTGCSSLQSGGSGKSWNQTAVNEQQQQQLHNSPQGDLDMAPEAGPELRW